MAMGTNLLMFIVMVNVLLIMTHPDNFQYTKVSQTLSGIGLDIINTTSFEEGSYAINTTKNETQMQEEYGNVAGSGGVLSVALSAFFDPILSLGRFIIWIFSLLYAPVTLANQMNAPWQITIFIGVVFTAGYFIAIISWLRGVEF